MGGVWLTGGALQRSRELTKTIFCGHSLGIICALSSDKAPKFCLISAEKKSPVINLRWRLLKSWGLCEKQYMPKAGQLWTGKSPLNVLDLVSTNKIGGAVAWRSSSSSRRTNNNCYSLLHPSLSIWIHQSPFNLWLCLKLLDLLLPISNMYSNPFESIHPSIWAPQDPFKIHVVFR